MRRLFLSAWFVIAGSLLGPFAQIASPNSQGPDYVPLRTIAARLGMDARQLSGDSFQLSSQWTSLEFTFHRRDARLNGHRVFLGFPVARKLGQLQLAEADYTNLLQPILTPQLFPPDQPVRLIYLDPGHGGKDTGARNTRLQLLEKSLVLDLARRLRKQLQKAGFTVRLTRDSDTFLPLAKRAQIANEAGADLFLSLHFNASTKPDVHGIETFTLTPAAQAPTGRLQRRKDDFQTLPGNRSDHLNTLLGFYIQRALLTELQAPDRGLKRARFAVLKNLRMPGVLIEAGFLSHHLEGRNVGSAAYRDRIAKAITSAVMTYQKTQERSREELNR